MHSCKMSGLLVTLASHQEQAPVMSGQPPFQQLELRAATAAVYEADKQGITGT